MRLSVLNGHILSQKKKKKKKKKDLIVSLKWEFKLWLSRLRTQHNVCEDAVQSLAWISGLSKDLESPQAAV